MRFVCALLRYVSSLVLLLLFSHYFFFMCAQVQGQEFLGHITALCATSAF